MNKNGGNKINKTLIIYDNEGYIIQEITGFYRIPVGIPYLEAEIEQGKRVVRVNVETKELILEDLPKTDTEKIKELKQENMLLQDAVIELASIVGAEKVVSKLNRSLEN